MEFVQSLASEMHRDSLTPLALGPINASILPNGVKMAKEVRVSMASQVSSDDNTVSKPGLQ